MGGTQVDPAAPVDFANSTGAAGPTWIHPKPPRSPPNPPPIWPPPLNTPEESVQTYSYYRYPVFVGLSAAAGKWAGAVRDQMNYPMCARFGSWWKLGRSRAKQRKAAQSSAKQRKAAQRSAKERKGAQSSTNHPFSTARKSRYVTQDQGNCSSVIAYAKTRNVHPVRATFPRYQIR